jgi:hypothetical protein
MARKTNKVATQTIADAKKSEAILPGIDGKLSENLKCVILTALIKDAEDKVASIKTLESEIDVVKDNLKITIAKIKDFQKRLRSGAKSAFGDDSLEFERVGGKRVSEYKKHAKKKDASTAA